MNVQNNYKLLQHYLALTVKCSLLLCEIKTQINLRSVFKSEYEKRH